MICPNCGYDNLAGLDQCEQCLQDFRTLDVPLPTEGLQKHIMVGTIGQVEFPFDRLVIVGPTDSVAHTVSRIKASGIGQALVVEGALLLLGGEYPHEAASLKRARAHSRTAITAPALTSMIHSDSSWPLVPVRLMRLASEATYA